MSAAAALCLSVLLARPEGASEPSYGGRPLSEWVRQLKEAKTPGAQADAHRALAAIGQPSVRLLVEILREEGPARRAAIDVLGDIGPAAREAAPALRQALQDKDRALRVAVSGALGRIDSEALPQVLPMLAPALKDRDPSIRIDAAVQLGKIGPPAKDAVASLVSALRDQSLEVRAAAAQSLGRIGPAAREAIPALEETLRRAEALPSPAREEELVVWLHAKEALERIRVTSREAKP